MQFEEITMFNFMRYKGKNTIKFSCDPKRNVTVVLGDNTVGKTTIAQAFRFGLYGVIQTEKKQTQQDYTLLNKDVIALMDANTRGKVSVSIVIRQEDENRRYFLKREIVYKRSYPRFQIEPLAKRVQLSYTGIYEGAGAIVDVEEGEIQTVIQDLLPKDLSQFFLFDGEKWNEDSGSGQKEDIKESVHKLTGLTSVYNAMYHLKDMGSNSVMSQLRGKLDKGGGAISDSLEEDIKREEYQIQKEQEKIDTFQKNIRHEEKTLAEIDAYLETHRETEMAQRAYKELERSVARAENSQLPAYRTLVQNFSEKGMFYLAKPMLDRCIELLEETKQDRKDIPYIRQASIDYLLKNHRCVCGACLQEGSEAWQNLLQQREYLPPADIGSLLGNFQSTARQWNNRGDGLKEQMLEQARQVKQNLENYIDLQNRYVSEGKLLDENVNFAEKRKEEADCKARIRQLERDQHTSEDRIASKKQHIARMAKELEEMAVKSEANRMFQEQIDWVTALYEQLKEEYRAKEKKTFVSLNQKIQDNFYRMFRAKDKKVELDSKYNINMLYKQGEAFAIEKNLSEGEKVARNFAFIAALLEYEKELKTVGDQNATTLPIVLDGPFAKLGKENIQLISAVLPLVADQVIIFMLDKDWKYTNLDAYVGARYEIVKEAEEGYASIREVEVE
ncbi:MAG: AAA family ATPase [Lachnospiraceae bacterium]